MEDDPDLRRCELAIELAFHLGYKVSVVPWERGFDFFADLMVSDTSEPRVVLSPRSEVLDTSYEGQVDFGDVVLRQAQAYRVADRADIAVPKVHLALHRNRTRVGRSLLVLDRLDDDGSWSVATEHQLGKILARLHSLPGTFVAPTTNESWLESVASGLGLRLGAAARYVKFAPVDVEGVLRSASNGLPPRRTDRFLHLDVRRPNIRVVDAEIKGLIDFANSRMGDPVFELARMRYSNLLTYDFLRGYGIDDPEAWLDRHCKLLAVYELNIAALLVVVGIEEANDEELASAASTRLIELADIVNEV